MSSHSISPSGSPALPWLQMPGNDDSALLAISRNKLPRYIWIEHLIPIIELKGRPTDRPTDRQNRDKKSAHYSRSIFRQKWSLIDVGTISGRWRQRENFYLIPAVIWHRFRILDEGYLSGRRRGREGREIGGADTVVILCVSIAQPPTIFNSYGQRLTSFTIYIV